MDVVAGRLQGIGSVGSTTHEAGATIMPGNGGFETLTIKGDYIGKGGTVEIATVLGDDNSQTSRLAITGSTSGAGIVKVTNRDGLGAMTKEGIRIISVGGTSDAAFTLQGDFITKAGEQAVVGGAYAYMLQKNGVANSNDGAWHMPA
uniref:Autochaperone domain-containing protein n=1 Tax=Panagrolaimus superbus TaxID=310955 RepID=A0A914ZHL1_9BILA